VRYWDVLGGSKMKLSKKSGLSFFGLAVLITAMTFVLINNSNTNLAYAGLSTDPSNIPIPEFDFDNPARAMVVTVFFNSESDVIFESAQVSSVGAPANIGNPPMLMTKTFDVDGKLMGEFNNWHPLFLEEQNADGTFSSIFLDSGRATFIVPFEPTLDSLMIVDMEQNVELISVDLAAPIRAFCQDNPDHPDCPELADVIDNILSQIRGILASILGLDTRVTGLEDRVSELEEKIGLLHPPDAPTSGPTTAVLVSAELISGVYHLVWILPPTSLGTPDGGYDIVIDGVDDDAHRTTELQIEITDINTSITHCFSVQVRWTQVSSDFPIGNEICVLP